MVSYESLIADEEEAIQQYEEMLRTHAFARPKEIHEIKKILADEQKHLKVLKSLVR